MAPNLQRNGPGPNPKRPLRRFLIAVGLVICAWLCIGLIRDNRYNRIGESWLTVAKSEITPATTFDDAASWLDGHGFQVLNSGGGFVGFRGSGGQGQRSIVRGLKRLGSGSLLVGDRTIAIEFQFSDDGKLLDVILDKYALPPPWWRPTTTQRVSGIVPTEEEKLALLL